MFGLSSIAAQSAYVSVLYVLLLLAYPFAPEEKILKKVTKTLKGRGRRDSETDLEKEGELEEKGVNGSKSEDDILYLHCYDTDGPDVISYVC